MIALVFAQLAARWGQALTLLVLSAAVTTTLVSAQVYADSVDRAAIVNELADSDSRDRIASFPVALQAAERPGITVEDYEVALAQMPSFVPVVTAQIGVQGLREDAPASEVNRLLSRDGFCREAVFEQGRCPVGSREAALPAALAEETGRGAGDVVVLTPVVRVESGVIPDGEPVAITLTGVFRARDPADPYWDAALDPLGHRSGFAAILTNRTTLQTWEHTQELFYVDVVLPEPALTPARIPRLRDELAAANAQTGTLAGSSISGELITSLPAMLDRITAQGDQARALLPITAAPLAALGWLVVYLAVSHGMSARRHEIGVVALRGARSRNRWVAVAAESMLPVLVGAPLGIALAQLLVAVAGPGGGQLVVVDQGQLVAAGVALAGAVVAVLVALRQELAAPVAQLLRRVPPRRRLAVAAVELLAVGLAVVVVADLRAFDRELVGLMIAAPAVVMVAVTVLAARLVRPLINVVGQWSLRRGRLAPAMAALYLARQPSAARLLVVLALVLGMLGFAMVSTDVAAQGRVTEAGRTLGAARVLTAQQPDPEWLLAAVRAVDPVGEYAMAVVGGPGVGQAGPRLAVDSTRLAQVALWSGREGDLAAAEVAARLRPPAPEPVRVDNGELVAELSPRGSYTADGVVTVSVLLAATGASVEPVSFAPVTAGEQTYRATVTGCDDGCRLVGLAATHDASGRPGSSSEDDRFSIVLHGLRLDGRELLPGEWLTTVGRWRPPESSSFQEHLTVSVDEDGLRLSHRAPRTGTPNPLYAVDSPYPLPVVTAGPALPGQLVTNFDGEQVPAAEEARLAALPGLGEAGVMMDLEYASRTAAAPMAPRTAQVWLAEGTPEEIVELLQDEGLIIINDQTVEDLTATFDRGGAALALRFFLLAGGGAALVGLLALALVVAVDRRGWARGMGALRVQGLAERTTTRAGRWSYGGIVLAAVVAGGLAVGAAWVAAGDRLPLGVDESVRPPWPQWAPVLVPWTVVVAVLLVAAVVAAYWQRAELRTEGRG